MLRADVVWAQLFSEPGAGSDLPALQTTARREGDTYVVVPGDTLSGIAVKTGIPLFRLERLNPDIDAATLNAGQQIKLR